ncbi:hypothetical protein GWO43_13480 [candidate division KSB1 bacterium]|nr:hypothetical protein [candidate division KSB1 bacterium]NIS24941.1 hypothetical protein [candidate division KSB1 bacterium]NIT71861.1 hypothetical protein [candidate division KSB1 bacterium]NIU25594.1 hypothetical protein [candidate division KSB1 bacterium]NIV91991.1 hypothetical protein [candidate division KSB1 bacterium]
MQGIEVKIAEKTFRTDGVRNYVNPQPLSIQLPEGTFIIPMDQPDQPLIKAILEFDPRMKTEFLKSERESLQKGTGTRLYEVSAWSMLMAYDLEAYASPQSPTVATRQIKELPQLSGQVVNPNPKYGYIIDYHNDKAVGALLTLLRAGYNVRAAQKPIRIEGRDYPRGTLLLRANENPSTMSSFIQHLSDSLGVMIYGVTTARSQKGPDLGGGEFELLVPPRIAVIAGSSISPYSFGSIWHWLDYEWKYRFTILNHHRFGRADLRKYNVLILPSVWGGPSTYRDIFQESGLKKLKDWVADGGTLIGIGTAAAFLADSTTGLSKVKLRCQVLKDLDQYRRAVKREQQLDNIRVDSLAIWEGTKTDESDILTNDQKSPDIETLKFIDEHQRLYQPRGAILKVNLDEEHWLSYGLTEHVPAIYYANYAYMSKSPVQTAGRFSEASSIRLSGLMWSEAKQRWENTAYVTRESYQKGQIILIAGEPIFRSYFYGTGRILLNSIFLGPGFGTQTVVPW